MSERAWAQVEEAVERYYSDLLSRLRRGRLEGRRPNVLFAALVGKGASRLSSLERTAVTLLGQYAPEFFKPFFADVEQLPAPFDFRGALRGREYHVLVVSGPDAFNRVTEDHVAEASLRYGNPVILTLQGPYFEPRRVGRAEWLPAPRSWELVAGRGAYQRFRDIVFEKGRARRDEVWRLLREQA